MPSAVASVIIASAQAVGKVYVIGALGYFAVLLPKRNPLLPAQYVGVVARFAFNCLTLPLIYSTIAKTVSPSSIGSLWFILVSAVVVITSSYLTATVLGQLPCFKIKNKTDFDGLRIAASFPNILSLPILIFPALCEFDIVHEAFSGFDTNEEPSSSEMYQSCVERSNAMVFVYFFGWSLSFWCFGYRKLLQAAKEKQCRKSEDDSGTNNNNNSSLQQDEEQQPQQKLRGEGDLSPHDDIEENEESSVQSTGTASASSNITQDNDNTNNNETESLIQVISIAIKQTLTSPGFIAMLLGFVTASIPPLQRALFTPGGSLRFLGSALDTLGSATSSVSTMVVAASLVPKRNKEETHDSTPRCGHTDAQQTPNDEENYNDNVPQIDNDGTDALHAAESPATESSSQTDSQQHQTENPMMSDPNFGPASLRRRSSIQKLTLSIRRKSNRALTSMRKRKGSSSNIRTQVWFLVAKLFVSPAIICLILIGLDCGGVLAAANIPNLAKLVVLLNAALPGALMITVVLKANSLSESASVVASVYLPSYLLSIVTIAAWSAIGLWISIPVDGTSFCLA